MKEKKKTLILIIMTIVLIIAIIVTTILYLSKVSKNRSNIELYNLWYIYKEEIITNNKIVDTLNTNNYYLNITENQIAICDTNKDCININYTYTNDNLKIIDNNKYLSGTYKSRITNTTMVLEKIENENTKTSLKYYFQKPLG